MASMKGGTLLSNTGIKIFDFHDNDVLFTTRSDVYSAVVNFHFVVGQVWHA